MAIANDGWQLSTTRQMHFLRSFARCMHGPLQECRRSWAERAYAGEDLDIEAESSKINHERLFAAKAAYDAKAKVHSCIANVVAYRLGCCFQDSKSSRAQAPAAPKLQLKQQFNAGGKTCDFCKKPGHIAKNCFSNPQSASFKGPKSGKGTGHGGKSFSPGCFTPLFAARNAQEALRDSRRSQHRETQPRRSALRTVGRTVRKHWQNQ